MIDASTIATFASNPETFRSALIIDSDAGPVRFGNVLDPWQREDFAALDSGWLRATGRATAGRSRAYLERPRGHSKTLDIATMSLWALAFSRNQLLGVAAAADLEQARLLRDAVAKLVGLNGWLAEVIEVQAKRVRNLRTQSELVILSSDVNSSYGLTCDFVVADELSHWQDSNLWHSLVSTAGKRAHCLLLVISNAGFGKGTSWVWTAREACRREPQWYFRTLAGPCASWISEETLAEQRRLLPDIAFRRLWLNQWTATSGDALTEQDIQAAVNPDLAPMTGTEPGWVWFTGLDVAVRRDDTALVTVGRHSGYVEQLESAPVRQLPTMLRAMVDLEIIEGPAQPDPEYRYHAGDGRLRLADCQSWSPTAGAAIDLDEVESAAVETARRFKSVIFFDPTQSEMIGQHLQKKGVPCVRVPFQGARLNEMATQLLEVFRGGMIELYEHPKLIRDLERLRLVQRSFGYKLEPSRDPGQGHGDRAVAFVLALMAIRENPLTSPQTVEGELVCYP